MASVLVSVDNTIAISSCNFDKFPAPVIAYLLFDLRLERSPRLSLSIASEGCKPAMGSFVRVRFHASLMAIVEFDVSVRYSVGSSREIFFSKERDTTYMRLIVGVSISCTISGR